MTRCCAVLLLASLISFTFANESAAPATDDLLTAFRIKQDDYAADVASHNTEQQPEHDISGLTSAMKSQKDAGMAAAENVLSDESHDGTGVSTAGRQPSSCSHNSIENTVSALLTGGVEV